MEKLAQAILLLQLVMLWLIARVIWIIIYFAMLWFQLVPWLPNDDALLLLFRYQPENRHFLLSELSSCAKVTPFTCLSWGLQWFLDACAISSFYLSHVTSWALTCSRCWADWNLWFRFRLTWGDLQPNNRLIGLWLVLASEQKIHKYSIANRLNYPEPNICLCQTQVNGYNGYNGGWPSAR